MGPNGITCRCSFKLDLSPIRTLLELMIFSQLNPEQPMSRGHRALRCVTFHTAGECEAC
jgi:hypothetical protein